MNILHVLNDLEHLEESMPVSIIRSIHCGTLTGATTGMVFLAEFGPLGIRNTFRDTQLGGFPLGSLAYDQR